MRRDSRVWGPHREELCPCGSRRRIRSCHGRPDGSWRAEPWSPRPPKQDASYSHRGCYAGSLGDCSANLSREHYVSRAVLQEISPDPILAGLSFLRGEEKRLPVSALAARILCRRHNSQLAELDDEAAKSFRALRRFENGNKDSVVAPSDDFEFVDGPRLEAWMLKTLFGLLAAGVLTGSSGPLVRVREGAEPALLEVLFRGGAWPDGWGIWVHPIDGRFGAAADLVVGAHGSDDQVWVADFEFGPFLFQLSLGRPDNQAAIHRPGALVVLKDQVDVQKILAIGWPDGLGGQPVLTTRTGQMEGWDTSRHSGNPPR